MPNTVTVTRKGTTVKTRKYELSFSQLPKQAFGPYEFAEAIRDLRISALLSPLDARNLVMDAATNGTAAAETGE